VDKSEPVDPAMLALAALGELGDGNLKIICHQFGPTLLYLPVYLFFHEVKVKWNVSFPRGNLALSYLNHGSDEEAYKAVIKGSGWDEKNNILELGVSEVPKIERVGHSEGNIIECPFVKRLPLWGLALVNNPRINWFKRLSLDGRDAGETRLAIERDVRMSYWKVFAGKLSLLQPEDLLNSEIRLGVSVYPRGSTVFRLFEEFMERRTNAGTSSRISFTSEVTFENEFDDLFNGLVDVALTVQPWRAIREAHRRGCDVEIVYVHHARPAPFTSLYAKKNKTVSENNLLKSVMDSTNLGIQTKVESLYEPSSDRMAEYISVFEAVEANDQSRVEPGATILTGCSTWKSEDMESALQVLSDSRIYYFDGLSIHDSSRDKRFEKVKSELRDASNLRYIANVGYLPKLVDPIELISKQVAIIPNSVTVHSTDRLENILGENITALKTIANALDFMWSDQWTCADLKENWRWNGLSKVMPEVFEKAKTFCPAELWRRKNIDNGAMVSYEIWADLKKLKTAFTHFDNQFRGPDGFDPILIDTDFMDVFQGDVRVVWLWIEYNTKNGEEKTKDFLSDPRCKFMDRIQNGYGHMLLNGWYISKANNKSYNWFYKPDHGQVAVEQDISTKVTLTVNAIYQVVTGGRDLKCVNSKPYLIKNNGPMIAEHGMLFTFRVHKLSNE